MARRNLRKWAEAKQRRAEQRPPPRGRWFYIGDFDRPLAVFIEDPDPPSGTYITPTRFLPMCDEVPTPYLSREWRERIWAETQGRQS